MQDSIPPRSTLRWYQFSLRTLLVVVLLLSVFFGWFASRVQRASKNRQRLAVLENSVAAIEELGGTVVTHYHKTRSSSWLEELLDDPGDPMDPIGVLTVKVVWFDRSKVTKADLQRARLTDAHLEHLKGMTTLEELSFAYTGVSDTGLKHLKGLSKLRRLCLCGTKVTDAGLEHLKGLTQLKSLTLSNTDVTDDGLQHLKLLRSLRYVNLKYTKVTEQGVKELDKALPNCDISISRVRPG